MQVRMIDVQDDDEVAGWWKVAKTVDAYGRDYPAFWSLRAATIAFRAENNTMRQLPMAAFDDDGRVIGVNQVHMPLRDNVHMAYVDPMVLPEHRNQGVGSALLEASLRVVAEAGRSTALCEVNLPLQEAPDSPDLGFAHRHGFEVGILDIHRVLDLPVSSERLDELEAESAPHHGGYQIVAWTDRVPEERMEGFCDLQMAFNSEAPAGEIELENEVWDEKRVREAEQRHAKQGRHQNVVAALRPDESMVGLTEMMTTEDNPDLGWQSGTLVLSSDRGHRLGMAMKVANLRLFQRRFPDVATIHSWNAEENGPMVAINDALGFRAVERVVEMQRKLA
jgi:GNAT superfamily N-acetyltransferase